MIAIAIFLREFRMVCDTLLLWPGHDNTEIGKMFRGSYLKSVGNDGTSSKRPSQA